MPHASFVHLHVHTDYSLLDGACRINELAKLAKEYNLPALAITDHGNMSGAIEFYKTIEKAGVKPIIGQEAYIAPGARTDKTTIDGVTSFHLTLLAKDETGYKNLIKLSSIGWLEGFYYKPRIDKEVLREYTKGLIGLSGCLKGEVPYWITRGDFKKAKELASEYKEIFGEDNFYFEIMRLGLKDNDLVNGELIKIGAELGIPLVATNDCHYISQDDAEAHDVLLCLQTHQELDESKRLRFESKEVYFKSPHEMQTLFSDHPEIIENTIKVADRCNLQLELDPTNLKLPRYILPEGYTSTDKYLEVLASEGLKLKYKDLKKEILERFQYELTTIEKMGYAGYFMIIKDIIDEARRRDIPVGPGRGSAVGSIVCYCLGITEVDPLKYDLIFERFLNPGRLAMPDIDVDIGDERRGELIEYIMNKYGKDSVCQIITFGTLRARAVLRDVGRVLKIPYSMVDKLAKLVPSNADIEEALEISDFKTLAEGSDEFKKLITIASKLEGLARHSSTHAAGIVVAPGKSVDYIPLCKTEEGIVSQYTMESVEQIGLIKIDLLGLRTLTVIHNTKEKLKQQGVDTKEMSLKDTKTFNLLKRGDTVGVFQLESEGMRDILRKIAPDEFTDIIAVIALYRPGPMGGAPKDKFIRCKHGEEKPEYLHPLLESILKETQGIILYQEQVMQIASQVGGFSMSEADLLRRAMSKKIPEIMDEKRKAFVEGSKKNKVSEDIANKIFDLIIPFAGYGFNKSHSAGYSCIAYEAAWLKANFQNEFMAASLSSEWQDTDRIKILIDECKKLKIKVLPPDINNSKVAFEIEDNGIRYGFATLRNLGRGVAEEIVKKQHYKGFTDFINRTNLNRKAFESLIKAGAFDSMEPNREKLMEQLNRKFSGQLGLFKAGKSEKKEDWAKAELLSWEKEAFGFYFSSHPLEKYIDELKAFTTAQIQEVQDIQQNEEVVIGGVVIRKKILKDKEVSFISIEDFSGNIDIVLYQDVFDVKDIDAEEAILVRGKVSKRDDKTTVRAYKIIKMSRLRKEFIPRLDVQLNISELSKEILEKLKEFLSATPGNSEVYLHLLSGNGDKVILKTPIKITPKRSLCAKLREQFGEKAITFVASPI